MADTLQVKALPQIEGYTKPEEHRIDFKDVSFTHGKKQILSKASFTVLEGTTTALVGESGSSKTTTANLLRFWDIQSGRISIGGTDIRTFAQGKFYKLFSVVF